MRTRFVLGCMSATLLLAFAGQALTAASASAGPVVKVRTRVCLIDFIICESDSVVVTMGSGKTAAAAIATPGNTLEGVTREGKACHSAGEPEGVVKTEPTTLEVGWINRKAKQVGLEERPTEGGLLASMQCGEQSVELRGSYIGVVAPANKTIKAGEHLTDQVRVNAITGMDEVTHFEGGPPAVMEEQVNGGGFHEVPVEDSGTLEPENATLKIKASAKLVEFQIKEKKPKK
jgi:hypothetical protein